jgi:hypothetical protein
MTKRKSAKTKQKISRGLKEYWDEKGRSQATKLGATLALGAAGIYGVKKSGLNKTLVNKASDYKNLAKQKIGDEIEERVYRALRDPYAPETFIGNKIAKGAKRGITEREITRARDTFKNTKEAFQKGADSTQAISVNDLNYRLGRSMARLYKRIKKRAAEDTKKLGFSRSFYSDPNYIEFKVNLTKGAVKVGAHLRDGKWIQGFKQTRNLAKQTAAPRKALKATTNPAGYVRDETLSKAALETARRGGSELAKKSNNRFVQTGELPNRAEAAEALGGQARSFATELIRNPRATIARGLQREAEALKALTNEFGPPPITRGTVIKKSLEPAKNQFAVKSQELLNNPGEFLKSELGQTWQVAKSDLAMGTYPAVGGLVGSTIGKAALGPAGGIAGDITGDLVTRKGIADTRGLVNAIKNRQSLPKLEPEFGVNERLQRFGQIIEDAKARSTAELTENRNKELADAFGGWIPGAGVGDVLLGGAVPGAGVLPGMAGSIYAQAVEKRIRDAGEDVATAATNYFRDKIKVGNAREQALREQIKDKWTRLLYLEASS